MVDYNEKSTPIFTSILFFIVLLSVGYFFFLVLATFLFVKRNQQPELLFRELSFCFLLLLGSYLFIDRKLFCDVSVKRYVHEFTVGCTGPVLIYSIFIGCAVLLSRNAVVFTKRAEFSVYILSGCILLVAATSEELMFRQVIPAYIKRLTHAKTFTSIFIASFLFSLVHLINPAVNNIGLLNIFLGGIVLAVLRYQSDTILMPIGFHFSWNLIQSFFYGTDLGGNVFPHFVRYARSFDNWFLGSECQFESSPLLTLLLFIFGACRVCWKKFW